MFDRVYWHHLPFEGKGHTFESCRVRQIFLVLLRDMRARTAAAMPCHSRE